MYVLLNLMKPVNNLNLKILCIFSTVECVEFIFFIYLFSYSPYYILVSLIFIIKTEKKVYA